MNSAPPPYEPLPDQGWTHVSKGKKSARPQSLDPFRANPVDATRTLQNIQADFQLKLRAWQSSSCRTHYFKTLDQRAPDEGWPITKAVCLASGSFSRTNYESRQRTVYQFAAFIDTVRHIQETSRTVTPIRIFAQDPAYTPTDENFLSSIGVEFLKYDLGADRSLGLAEQHLGPNTMVAELCIDCSREKVRALCQSGAPLFAFSTFTGFLDKDRSLGGTVTHNANGQHIYQQDRFHDMPEDAQIAVDFVKQHSEYKLAEFDPSPNTFRSFKALVRLSEEDE